MKLIRRKDWGARSPRDPLQHLAGTRGVKVHYTGATETQRTHGQCAARVRSIQNDHMGGNGWDDIGYSFLVCQHGYVFEGRGLHHLPAANGPGLNSGHYAVCGLVGNKGVTAPSGSMLSGIVDAIRYCRSSGNAGAEIRGHRDGYSTDCPGTALYAWVRKGAPRPGTQPPTPTHAPAFVRNLTQPPIMRGPEVRLWQLRMQARGWQLDADGAYGSDSEAKCRAFQADKGIKVTGIVDSRTWHATWETPVT